MAKRTIQRLINRHPIGDRTRTLASQRRVLFAVLQVLLVAAVFLINLIMLQLAERMSLTLDLTANAAYKVGDQTRTVLASLERDVTIYVLSTQEGFSGSSYLIQAQRILDQYPRLSPWVSLTYIDYVFDPTFASRFPDLTLAQGNVLVTSGNRVKQLQLADLFNYSYTDSGTMTIQSSRAEEAVTSAILFVTGDEQVRVAVLTGNGMADLPAFTRLLSDNNYEVTAINLTMDELGDSYDLAVLLGPRIDPSDDALRKLDAFLYNDGAYGKTLLYTADVAQESLPNLELYLQEWGVLVGAGAVFETQAERTYQYQPYYPVTDYVAAMVREGLIDPSAPVLMPLARPLDLTFETRGSHVNEVLLQYAETSGVRPPDAVEGFSVEQTERWGPMPALVLASNRVYGTDGTTQARSNIIVSASTAMLDEFAIQNTSLSNSQYVISLLNALLERDDLVVIQPKSLAGATLSVTTTQASTLGILFAGVLPLAILATGIVIWLFRRYQ